MDVTLPSGVVIRGVPEGTSKEAIKAKAIAAGLATEADFGVPEPSPQQRTGEVPVLPEQMGQLPEVYVPQPKPDRSTGERIMGGLEAGASAIASGIPAMAGMTAGAAEGALQYLANGDFSQPPGKLVHQRAMAGAQRMTAPFTPPSEAGREYLQEAGEALSPLSAIAPVSTGMGSALATSAKMAMQSPRSTLINPMGRVIDAAVPDQAQQPIAGEFIPKGAEAAVKKPWIETKSSAARREALNQNTTESVGYKIDPSSGRVVANMLERDLVDKFGIGENAIIATREFKGPAKRPAVQMLDIAERYVKGDKNVRPNVVIGDSLMKRFKRVVAANKVAGKKIDEIAGAELSGKRVDVSNALNTFEKDLSDMGVTFDGKGRPNFKGSQLSGNSAIGPINRVYEWIGERNRVNALMLRESNTVQDGLKLHKMKRFIDRQIEWGRDPSQPLDKQAVLALKNLRRNINEELKKVSPSYAEQNAIYSETIEPIGKMTDVLGRRFDPDAPRVDSYVGQELRKTLSNYGVSNDMRTAIDSIDSIARKHGGVYDDKIMPLVEFYSDMEGVLGSFAPNSLQGVGEKVASATASKFGMAGEVAATIGGAAKRRSPFWDAPVKDKLELINKLREQVKSQ